MGDSIAVLEAKHPGRSGPSAMMDTPMRQWQEPTAPVQHAEQLQGEAASVQSQQEGGSAASNRDPVVAQADVAVQGEITVTRGTTKVGFWPWGTWGWTMPAPAQVPIGQMGTSSPAGGSLNMISTPGIASQSGAGIRLDGVANKYMPETGYNSVLHQALPEGDQSLPLGGHLLPAIIEKISRKNT